MGAAAELVHELTTHPTTAALVADRVMPRTLPADATLPAIVHNRISGPRQYSHGGDTGLRAPRYQLDCWAKDPDTADAVAEAAIAVLSGRSFGDVRFTTIAGDRDDYEPDTGLCRRIVDVMPHMEN